MAPAARIGTSGWSYDHWRGVFYPPELAHEDWFAHYARHFDTVEINNSFYRLPDEDTIAHWRDAAPAGFLYAVKANRYLTHVKRLNDCAEALERFIQRVRGLGERLGPILYQLPPRWRARPDRLADFCARLPGDLDHVFEFRDPGWYIDPVRDALADRGASFCIHDHGGLDCPDWVTGRIVYYRFHGAPDRRAGRYDDDALAHAADAIGRHLADGRPVFAYFNNDAEGAALDNARTLREMVGAA